MVDILHRVGTQASPEDVYGALTTNAGLADWWTDQTAGGDGGVGDTIEFRFGELGGFDMRVDELVPAKRVAWTVTGGPDEWIGTTVHFDLHTANDHTIVMFKHEGWAEPVEFMHHCSTKWASYLLSLKALVETGTGAPHPNDVHVAEWD